MHGLYGVVGSFALFAAVLGQLVTDLSTARWTLTNGTNSVKGKFPSQVHLDLLAANIISEPYLGVNEIAYRWITLSNWTYISDSIHGLTGHDARRTYLLFDGLDTFADIYFCGQHVASTNNQFLQYYFEVSSIVRSCSRTAPNITIEFASSVDASARIASSQLDSPNVPLAPVYEFPNRQYIRKEQSDFGWDWGPAFAPAGPWQPAHIVQLDSLENIYIRGANFEVYREGQVHNLPPEQSADWIFNASIEVLGHIQNGTELTFSIAELEGIQITCGPMGNIVYGRDVITGTASLDPSKFRLWWPSGMGAQMLYNFTVNIADSSGHVMQSVNKRMGFRTIVLNQSKITDTQLAAGVAPGNNWHFEINGHPFYAKGSNFVPPDAFWLRVTPARIQQLFNSVILGNQNMLRVWASGAYSPDFMYDLADEMGILLWSEFEFSDSTYETDTAFVELVGREAVYQVRRINHHPSLALWVGGNEINRGNRYDHSYEELFLKVLLPAVYDNTHGISYIPSSTSNGYLELDFSREIPYVEMYQNGTGIYGDTGYYNYDASAAFDISKYPIGKLYLLPLGFAHTDKGLGRFAVEFGFHSMPSLQSWQQVLLHPDDFTFDSTTILTRMHHYPAGEPTPNQTKALRGMSEMTAAVIDWYPTPNIEDTVANFSAWCLSTQVFQADLYKNQVEFYRIGSGMPQNTLGSLYWQLEDIWQAPSWAGIEYDGRWKVLHYIMQDAYQPVIVALQYDRQTSLLYVYVVSDTWSVITGSLSLRWYDWRGNPLSVFGNSTNGSPSGSGLPGNPACEQLKFCIKALSSSLITTIDIGALKSNGLDESNAVLFANITAKATLPNANSASKLSHTSYYAPAPLSRAALVDPGLLVTYDGLGTFTVAAHNGVSTWTWLNIDDSWLGSQQAIVIFSSNGFWLAQGERKSVNYTVYKDETNGAWVGHVYANSTWDMTQYRR